MCDAFDYGYAAALKHAGRVLEEEVVEAAKGWLEKYSDEVRDPSEEYPCKRLVAAVDALNHAAPTNAEGQCAPRYRC